MKPGNQSFGDKDKNNLHNRTSFIYYRNSKLTFFSFYMLYDEIRKFSLYKPWQ